VGYLGAEASTSGWARAAVRGAWCAALAASAASCLLIAVALRAQMLTVHGAIDLERGNRAEAGEHFGRALSLQPNLVAARAMLGALHVQERDFSSAAKDYARALNDEPNSALLLSWYGYCLLRLGRDDEAIPVLARALELNPRNSQAAALLESARRREAEKAKAGEK
jgi:tetratricopeptide (TPR) repeat protein